MFDRNTFGIDNKFSTFRSFVFECYYKNCDERILYRDNSISIKEYVNNNKWFLKNKFKKEQLNVT